MKLFKSLTCLLAIVLVSACHGHSSATFSSSSSEESSQFSSYESASNPVSSSSMMNSDESSLESFSSVNASSEQSSSSSFIPEVNYYNDYYSSLVSWKNGEDLKNQLYTIIRNGYKPLTYDIPNYESNINADHTKDDFEYLDVVYSEDPIFKNDTFKGWQREHAFCASLMCGNPTGEAVKNKGRATDFHNLFAANSSANSSRGNKNYGTANVRDFNYVDRTTSDGLDGYSFDPINFEPGNYDKGRLARAIFYMATMYKNDEADTVNSITMKGLKIVESPVEYVQGESGYFAIGNLSTLLSWNKSFDVDYLEMQHNISVYQDIYTVDGYAQGNRNPFVDYPGLVDYVYGSKKNQSGTLKDVIASISYLGNEEHKISHYAIKEAKREYGLNEQLTTGDYVVNAIYHDFTVEDASAVSSIHNSLDTHVFTESDGDVVEASIITPINQIKYQIILNPMSLCSSGTLPITTTGINKKTPDVEQSIGLGNVQFLFNFSTTYASVSSAGMTINNISSGGITIGSDPRPLTKLILKTKEAYTVDKAFIKAMTGNVSSSYTLTIKVGDTSLYSSYVNDSSGWKVFGGSFNETLTGQLSFVFVGSSSLKINSIAFNAIIA